MGANKAAGDRHICADVHPKTSNARDYWQENRPSPASSSAAAAASSDLMLSGKTGVQFRFLKTAFEKVLILYIVLLLSNRFIFCYIY
jgi:hypothetical protein